MSNRRKVVLYIAASIDGYIAREDDSLDWLFSVDGEGDNGYSEFYENVDTILMGKRTYDWIMEHESGNLPYKDRECFVFTRKPAEDVHNDVRFVNEDVVSFTDELVQQEGKSIWVVGGGNLLYSFLKENLVDELIVTVAPVVIGKGIPLFQQGDYELNLSLKSMKQYNQFAELHYEVKK